MKKVLLDPLKEEFNLPPVLVKKCYLGSINLKVVREVYKGSLVLNTIKSNAAKLARVTFV